MLTAIINVYELPSLKQVIKYYHTAAGYLTKTMWIKAINEGFFATWPLLTTRAVNKCFPESPETQKDHMWQQRQGVQSTQEKSNHPETHIVHEP